MWSKATSGTDGWSVLASERHEFFWKLFCFDYAFFCLERSRFSELATGWTTEEIGKFSARARNYSFVQSIESSSRVHATSYSVGTGVFTAGLK